MTLTEKLDKLLMRVEKPARYTGGELNTAKKELSGIKQDSALPFRTLTRSECLISDSRSSIIC